jgi:hypothetical protein
VCSLLDGKQPGPLSPAGCLRKFNLDPVAILQLVGIPQADICGDLDDVPWMVAGASLVLIRA